MIRILSVPLKGLLNTTHFKRNLASAIAPYLANFYTPKSPRDLTLVTPSPPWQNSLPHPEKFTTRISSAWFAMSVPPVLGASFIGLAPLDKHCHLVNTFLQYWTRFLHFSRRFLNLGVSMHSSTQHIPMISAIVASNWLWFYVCWWCRCLPFQDTVYHCYQLHQN